MRDYLYYRLRRGICTAPGRDAIFEIAALGIDLPLSEIYSGFATS
jgi:hypothetical protein